MKKLIKLWQGIRTLTGDDAYERYLQHQTVAHPTDSPLSRKDFFHQELQRRWNKMQRCC